MNFDKEINKARDMFSIQTYPQNLFNLIINQENYIDKYNILLFKQDTGITSGFIGYPEDKIALICINYTNNIGHQNFTLAHEIGHYFLHKGKITCDTNEELEINNKDRVEREANQFASELLYPKKCVRKDYDYIISNALLSNSNNIKMADYLNELSKKYCISFKFAYYRILTTFVVQGSSFNINSKYQDILSSIGGVLSQRYTIYDHCFVKDHPYYQPYVGPINQLKEYVNELSKKELISEQTGETIIERNSDLEGCK